MAAREGDTAFLEKYVGNDSVELSDAYQIYVTAYLVLDREREYHSHIPWSAFVRYGEFYQFTRDQIDMLIEVGYMVDNVILAERAKKAKQAARNGNT
jgi:hypothetical protein